MINLCNGGTNDFVELWEIMHLNIWTQLTYLRTLFFTPKWKKPCLKQQLQQLSQAKQSEKNIKNNV